MKGQKPFPYFDTMIILDYIRSRKKVSEDLLKLVLTKKIKSRISSYTILEIADRQQEDLWIKKNIDAGGSYDDFGRNRYPRKLDSGDLKTVSNQINDIFLEPFVNSRIIKVVHPQEKQHWDRIVELMLTTNISHHDAIHLAMAEKEGCNVLVTRDEPLTKATNTLNSIFACSSRNIDNELKKRGIQPFG